MIRSTFFGIVWLIVVMNGRCFGVITSTKVADATFTPTPNSEISFHTVTQPINLDRTNWIAWNEFATLTAADPSQPNTLLLGKPSIGVNDFLRLTVTNPTGNALTLDIDQNDGGANSFGPQAVIFGDADTAPDVFRFNELNGQSFLFDEGGSHNAIFTDSGNYQFDFSFQNIWATGAQNGTWLLMDVDPEVTVFDRDFDGWQSATGAVTTIDFDDIVIPGGEAFTALEPDHYSHLPGSPTITVSPDDEAIGRVIIIDDNRGEEVPTSSPNAMGINDDHGTTVRIEFEQPISALGGFFLDVEPRGVASTGFDTDLDGSPEVRFSSAPGDFSQAFLGFVIDPPVNVVDIHYATTCLPDGVPTCGDGISIDDLSYELVPELSSFFLLALALFAGLLRRVRPIRQAVADKAILDALTG